MTQEKEILKKLVAIAENQQKILTKLAQQLPTKLEPGSPTKKEAESILNELQTKQPGVRAAILQLEVHPGRDANTVKVRFDPKKNTPAVFNALQRTVTDLQKRNVLPAPSYNIMEVA